MKNLFISMLCFILLTGLSRSVTPLYQVISQHPHDLKALLPYVETVSQQGRLWIVQLKQPAPDSVMRHLKIVGDKKLGSWLYQEKKMPARKNYEAIVSKVISANIKRDVLKLASYKTRLVGSEDNRKALAWVQSELSTIGYRTQQICYRENHCSIVAEKTGTRPEVLMVMAHIDSVGKDFAGADDNASGTATLLEIARIISNRAMTKTVRFFVTNGEESGLLGAKHYADFLENNGELKLLDLVINMDMVGYNSNGIVELETDAPFEKLANEFAQATLQYTKLKPKITLGAWGSDHVPFIEKDVPSLLTIEDWSTKTPCYHTSCDKPNTLNYVYAGEIAKLNVAMLLNSDN